MTSRLRRQVGHAVAADHVPSEVVALGKGQLDLGPTGDIVGAEADFEGKVPDYAAVRLLALVRVLAHAAFVTLSTLKS